MNFDQKLTTLMNLFKISNSKLARSINVDASLVSRWKSGERKISLNSPHIPMLANYFLHINAYHYQKEYLDKIIAARLPEKERQDDASRVHVLADWLVSGEPPEAQPDEQPEQLAKSSSLIANIAGLLAGNPDQPEQPVATGIGRHAGRSGQHQCRQPTGSRRSSPAKPAPMRFSPAAAANGRLCSIFSTRSCSRTASWRSC